MKKVVRHSKEFLFILIVLLFAAFFYTLLLDNNIIIYDYIMFALFMVNLIIAGMSSVTLGLVVSAIMVFGYGSVIMYQNIVGADITLKLNYVWIGLFPFGAFLTGAISENINKMGKKLTYYEEECDQYKSIDSDTGFGNLNEFLKDLEIEMAKAKRYHYPLTLGMIEILYFDELRAVYKNDMDKVFKILSQALINKMRLEDNKYRIGEKTFAIVLPYTNIDGSMILKDRIKEELLELTIYEENMYKNFKFEIKIGLKELDDSIETPIKFKAAAEREIEYDV
jgi:diguanylate cyclase (GGDEF)-like protein